MKNSLRHYLKNLKRDKKRRRRSLALLLIVSMVVALSVSVGLRRTGVAMETTATTETEQQNAESAADTTAEATTVTETTDATTETDTTASDATDAAVTDTATDAEDSTAVTPVSEADAATEETTDDTAVSEETTDATTEETTEETTEGEEVVSSSSEDTTEDAADTFELSGQTTSGITVKVTGDAASLPYPADEITLEVKDQTMDDLSEEAKALYDKVLAVQNSNADKIVEEQTAEDGTVDEKDITEEAAQIASTTDGEIVKASDLEDGSVDDAETTTAGETADETTDTTEAAEETATDETVASTSEATTEDASEETTETTITNRLIDVTLKHGDEEVEPTGEVQVEITSDALKDTESMLTVIHLDETNNQAVDTEADVNTDSGIVALTMDSFSTVVVSKTKSGSTGVSYEDLATAFSNAAAGATITLEDNYDFSYDGASITVEKDIILNLNGHHIHFNNSSSCGFSVASGVTFTVEDLKAPSETVTEQSSANKYNNTATNSLDDNTNTDTLTYYVTESSVSGTTTTETVYKHEYSTSGYIAGDIKDGDQTGVIQVQSGGTFNLVSGLITCHTDYSGGYGNGHTVYNSGTFNMTGGYIAGRTTDQMGGGLCATDGSTSNLSGGVIAANTATNGGAGIYINDASTINVSGNAVISGNISNYSSAEYGGGGGIYADNAAVNISGGNITNNRYIGCNSDNNSKYGGGGVFANNNSVVTMTDGHVTGNYSQNAGGGMYIGSWNSKATLYLDGGTVASNYCETGEGAGIRIAGGNSTHSVGTISGSKATYITNNYNNTDTEWGGGGIFVQEGGDLSLTNALITQNTADGFGGGFSACPTGTSDLDMTRAAIYGNTANGNNFSQKIVNNNYNKQDDSEAAEGKYGYTITGTDATDYFVINYNHYTSGYIATLTNDMLGGGKSNWHGKATTGDNVYKLDINDADITGTTQITRIGAFTANPSTSDKENAVSAAKVFITNNHSHTNGGGIMTNGNVSVGEVRSRMTYPSITIDGVKELLLNNISQTIIDGEFSFYLLSAEPKYDSENNKWVYSGTTTNVTTTSDGYLATASVTEDGSFTFSDVSLADFVSEDATNKVITLYLVEAPGSDTSIDYDTTIWKIELPYSATETTDESSSLKVTTITYALQNSGTKFYKKSGTSSYVEDSSDSPTWTFALDTDAVSGKITTNSGKSSFSNTIPTAAIKIYKYASGTTSAALKGAEFAMYSDSACETQITEDATGTPLNTVTDENGELSLGYLKPGTYYLKETDAPDGYYAVDKVIMITVATDGTVKAEFTDESTIGLDVTTDYKISETESSNSSSTDSVYWINIANSTGSELPNTGGIGTTWFYVGGLILIALPVMYIIHKRRKGERRLSE